MLLNFRLFSKIYYALALLILIIAGSTISYKVIEGWTWLDSFYQTIITVSTVGFGEVHPLTENGKLYTAFLIITSFGTFAYAVSSITSYIVTGDYRKYFKDYKTMKNIDQIKNHVIVCGYGRVGQKTIETLKAHKENFIVLETDPTIIEKFRLDGNVLYLHGNATEDETLIDAGIKNAKALITALPSDADNLFVVLSSKELNPNLKVISRASRPGTKKKLKMAGADNVIMPDSLGGSHMAQLVSTPDVVEFLDQISIQGENEITLEGISFRDIPEGCQFKSLADLKQQFPVCNIVGFKNAQGEYLINPSDDVEILPNSKIFVLGNPEQIKKLNEIFGISYS
ncbi:MAG: NAD-binding protein [Flavobacteriales bacterium]|jgi:voltage-gated potassium channel|nr:NAD-binding protein [Flavobacteriales bacterium]